MDRLEDLVLSITPPALTLAVMPQRQRSQIMEQHAELEGQVLEHFHRTCRFCGFQENSQIVKRMTQAAGDDPPATSLVLIPANGDPADLTAGNLAIACVFCQAVNSLNTLAKPDAWSVIYLPGLPQYYLSWVVRSVFLMSMIQDQHGQGGSDGDIDGSEKSALKILLDALRGLSQRFSAAQEMAARNTGFGSASILAQSLLDMAVRDPAAYQSRGELLTGYRLIPTACLDDNWSSFFKYRTIMIEATSYSGLRTFKDVVLVARQAYKAVYEDTFPAGDPLQMESEMGTRS
jgi:hypothetical protein